MEQKKQVKSSFWGNISIGKKIIASFISLILILTIPTFYGFKGLREVINSMNEVIHEKTPTLKHLQFARSRLDNTLIDLQKISLDDAKTDPALVDELKRNFLLSKASLIKIRHGSNSKEFKEILSMIEDKDGHFLFKNALNLKLEPNFLENLDKLTHQDYESFYHQTTELLKAHKEQVKYSYEIGGEFYNISSFAMKIFMDFREWNGKLAQAVEYDVPFKGETDYKNSLFYKFYEAYKVKDQKIAQILSKINGYNKRIYESAARINELSGNEKKDMFQVQIKTDFKKFEKELSNLVDTSTNLFAKLSTKQAEDIHGLEIIEATIKKDLVALEAVIQEDVILAEQKLKILSDGVQKVIFIVTAGAVLFSLFLARSLIKGIVRPLIYMSKAMREIANGNIDVYLRESSRKDEIGDMTQALFIFKKNKITSDAMALERQLEQEKVMIAEREQLKSQKIVLDRVGEIVAKCVKGDFSGRIDTMHLDKFMGELANGINQIGEVSHKGLSEIKHSLEDLSKGVLTTRMCGNYQGMFLEIKQSFNETAKKLEETVDDIISSSREIRDSSKEISTSCTDLASRSEKQVVTIEETSASMDELSTTIRSNSNNSLEASNFAKSAKNIAEKGGIVIKEVVTSMNQINESSVKISNIINVINEIAFRTNLLALNASIEAARAGEAGKGFSVVAAEVRALAGQAKDSAEEIQELVTKSVDQVYNGSLLVNEAGDTLTEVISSFNRVTTLMEEIAVASEQQTVGIERIHHAIALIDDNTVHNSSLVAQTATASHSLAHLGNKLNTLIGFFKTSDNRGNAFSDTQDEAKENNIDRFAS